MNNKDSILKSSLSVLGRHVGGVVISCIFCIGLSSLMVKPTGQIISSIIVLLIYMLPIYQISWDLGHRDLNRENFGHIKKDNFKGFKIGLIASIPIFVMTLLFVLSKFNLFYNFTWLFKILNAHIWPLINLIQISMFMPDYSIAETFGVAVLALISPLLIGIFYIMGNHDFSPMQRLVYKNKPKQKQPTSIRKK